MPKLESLNVINVASPCPADWNAMAGEDRKRFCSQCNLHVYNLSDMSEGEALTLVNAAEGRLCVRFFRRQDGTMLTRDCPVGLRAVRMKLARMWASAAAVFGAVTLSSFFSRGTHAEEGVLEPIEVKPDVRLLEVKGDVCFAPAPVSLDKVEVKNIVKLLQTARERDADKTGGMPDPLDPDVILESERQSLESRISAKDWKCPAPGTKEYDTLARQLNSVLKQHPDLLQQLLPQHVIAPPVVHEAVLGKIRLPK